jgi:NADH-quinone oxidoreductase subunit C
MKPNEIYQDIEISGKVLIDKLEKLSGEDAAELVIKLAPEALPDLAKYLLEKPELRFDSLMCLSGVDLGEALQIVYHLFSIEHRHRMTIKVNVPKEAPKVSTVSKVWPTAGWHEREAYDLVGVVFEGHEDLRRILLPEDWEGHPLRADYEFPKEHRGVPV